MTTNSISDSLFGVNKLMGNCEIPELISLESIVSTVLAKYEGRILNDSLKETMGVELVRELNSLGVRGLIFEFEHDGHGNVKPTPLVINRNGKSTHYKEHKNEKTDTSDRSGLGEVRQLQG